MNLETIGIDRETVLNLLVDKLADDVDVYSMGVRDLVQARIGKKIREDADGIIGSTLKETIDSILEKPITPIDSWGEPKGEPRTLKEMIKARAETYLSEKVDSDGRTSTCGKAPRLEYIVSKVVENQFDYHVKRELETAVLQAKADLRSKVAKYIADTVLNTRN